MADASPQNTRFIRFALIFAVVLLGVNFFTNRNGSQNAEDIDLVINRGRDVAQGKVVEVDIRNNLETAINLPEFCPQNPLQVERYNNGELLAISAQTDEANCSTEPVEIAPGKTYKLSYAPWNSQLFNELGRYQVSLNLEIDGKQKTYSEEVTIKSPSGLVQLWREGLYKPILNILLFLISVMPGKNLGLAVILLTLIIKLALVFPNHKALKSQKKMKEVQPQLEALKLKYKDDPQRMAQETMAIYKKYKVSPVSSCLPMLIQFPILIALFYVVRDGLTAINPDFLYANIQAIDLSLVNTQFAWLDLTQTNWYVLPIVVGGLQFFQMRMTLGKNQPTSNKPKKKKGGEMDLENPMMMMNKSMQYVMPVMVAVFTATLPAAVGIYWGTSTLFGLVQQLVINREK